MQAGRPVRPSDAPEGETAAPAPLTGSARRYFPNLAEKIDDLRGLRPDPSRVVPFPGVRLAPPPQPLDDDGAAVEADAAGGVDARREALGPEPTETATQLQIALFAQLKAELAAQLRELSDIAGRLVPAAEPAPIDAGARRAADVTAQSEAHEAAGGAAGGGAGDAARLATPAEAGVEAGFHAAAPVAAPLSAPLSARLPAPLSAPLPAPVGAAPVVDAPAAFSDLESSVHGLVAAARRQNGAFNETLLQIRLGLKEESARIDLAFAHAREEVLAPPPAGGFARAPEEAVVPAREDAFGTAPDVGDDAGMIALLDDIVGLVDAHESVFAAGKGSSGAAASEPSRGQESRRRASYGQDADRRAPPRAETSEDDLDAILAAMAARLAAPNHQPASRKNRAEPRTEPRIVRTGPQSRRSRAAGDAPSGDAPSGNAPSGKPRLRHAARAAMAADSTEDFLSLYGERRRLIGDDIEADISGLVRDVYRGGRQAAQPSIVAQPSIAAQPSLASLFPLAPPEPAARPAPPRPLSDPAAPTPQETPAARSTTAVATPPRDPAPAPARAKAGATPATKNWIDFLLRMGLFGATAFGALMLGAHLIKFDRAGAPAPVAAKTGSAETGSTVADPTAAPAGTGTTIDPGAKYIDTYASTGFTPADAPVMSAPAPTSAPPPGAASFPGPVSTPLPPPQTADGPAEIKSLIPLGGHLAATRARALNGDAEAQYRLANLLMEGKDIQRDPRAAAHWYQKAADQGFIKAYARLGALYENGVGVEKDHAQAIVWYKAAAEAGHVQSMHNLGVLLTNSEGGREDLPAAARWFRQAAEYGVRDSQYNLAIFYAQGEGVEASNLQAYVWSAIAARQGDAEAEKMRKEIAPKLSAQDMIKATVAIRKFNPKQPVGNINNT